MKLFNKEKYSHEFSEKYIKFGILRNNTLHPFDKKSIGAELQKIVSKTNMIILDDGFIKLSYESLYDLYFDEEIEEKLNESNEIIYIRYQNRVDTYKLFDLPELYDGYIRVKNKGNFAVTDKVIFEIEFWIRNTQIFPDKIQHNILQSGAKAYVLSQDTYKLVQQLVEYNRTETKNKDQYEQYSTLKIIKDALRGSDLFINKRLEMIEEPVLIDEIELSAEKIDDEIYIIPQIFENESEQKRFFSAFSNNISSHIYRLENKKVIFKNKEEIQAVHRHRKMQPEEFKKVLEGEHDLNYYEGLNLDGIYSPRVKGIGVVELKTAIKVGSSGQNWFDGEFSKYPITIESDEGEQYTLSMNDVDELEKAINSDKEIISFGRLIGNQEREFIATREEVKKLIDDLQASEITVDHIKSKNMLEELEYLLSQEKGDDYIVINGLSLFKDDNLEENIQKQKNVLIKQESIKRDNLGLEIIGNDDIQEYQEDIVFSMEQHQFIMPKMMQNHLKLFEHQVDGINRMSYLFENNERNGVLLADDMGLGKTLQIISLLAWLKETKNKTNFLIVAPKILMNNWIEEIQEFVEAEQLTISDPIIGRLAKTHRDTALKIDELKQYDIVLTTYSSLKINQISLGKIHWSVMVCDEIQKAKNPKSQIGYAIKTQNADFKIACTATPIENTTEDLWNIMDYARPGLLGSLKEFRNRFVVKVNDISKSEKNNYSRNEIENEIKNVMGPFVIRRQKKDILSDKLPKKRIVVDHLSPTSLENEYIRDVYDLLNMGESPLATVGHLIRICSHPNLYKKEKNLSLKKIISNSSKIQWLQKVLEEIEERNEKVLIFADVYLLQEFIIDVIYDKYGFVPEVINGKIAEGKRTKILRDFKKSHEFNCLILSTEVAGVGLTITEANNIIHYMRKWNPAKENQATDRVYRIGQDKDVNVYIPMIDFHKDGREEFDSMEEYLKAYDGKDPAGGSPDEKLNAILVNKNKLLDNFFYAVNENDMNLDFNEFLKESGNTEFGESTKKIIPEGILFEKVCQMDRFDYISYIGAYYNNNGYNVWRTQTKGMSKVDLVCKRQDEILLIHCHSDEIIPVSIFDMYKMQGEIDSISNNFSDIINIKFIVWSRSENIERNVKKYVQEHNSFFYNSAKDIRNTLVVKGICFSDLDKIPKTSESIQNVIGQYYERIS